jgi:hypothetical protein
MNEKIADLPLRRMTLPAQVSHVARTTRLKFLLLVLVSFLALPSVNYAQVTTGDILGTVTDPSKALIPGAEITLTQTDTGEVRHATSNTSGDFFFTALPIGHYKLEATASGFQKVSVGEIALSGGDRRRIDTALSLGSTGETVEVNTAPPALQTDSSTVGAVVGERAVQDLPLNNRNFIELAQTVAGANEGPPGALSGGSRPDDRRLTSSVSANGQDEYVNNQLIDGLDNNQRIKGGIGVRPSIDAIAEFRVSTNLYTAEVGRAAGAMINVITKPGTNQFHGSAYEFFRNDIFDARNFFARTGSKPRLRQNQFGGSLGGPIKRDKLFAFADYEGFRQVQGTTTTLTVPTLFEEQNPGNFTDLPTTNPNYDPVIVAHPDPIALRYFNLYPAPNLPGTTNNFVSTTNKTQYTSTADARVDYVMNPNNRIYARYTINNVDTNIPGALPLVGAVAPGGNYNAFYGASYQRSQNAQLNYLHVFNPNLLMELKGGFTRINNNAFPLNFGTNLSSTFGLTGVNVTPDASGLTPQGPTGYAALGDGTFEPIRDLDNVFQGMGSVTYIRGNNNIKIGGGLIHRQAKAAENSYGIGLYTYNTLSATASLNNVACKPLTCFLQGLPTSVQRSNQLDSPNLRTWESSAYLQDDWRAKQWLTLNLGLRYDFFTPFNEKHDFISNFDPSTSAILVANQNGVSRTAGVTNDFSNVAPRIGFAATLHQGTVLRGGYGITYIPNQIGLRLALGNPPYTFTYAPPANTTRLDAGLPVPTAQSISNLSGALAGIDTDYRSSIIHQTNLTVEQAFGANVFTLSYVGEFGRKLRVYRNLDLAPPAARGCTAPSSACYTNFLPFHAALPNVTAVNMMQSIGFQNYNALQASFLRRFSHGLDFNANYTWANALNDTSNFSTSSTIANVIPSEIATLDKGPSDINIRHRVAIQLNYALPFGNNLKGVEAIAAKGWQVNVLHRWETGLPFSVNDSVAYSNTGVGGGGERSRIINTANGGNVANPTISKWFDTSAFADQIFGTYVPMERNGLSGPHFRQLSFSTFKTVPLRDAFSLQFRAEFYNLTNTPNFAQPDSGFGDAAFGQISSTRTNANPRQTQFALKLLF